MEPQTIQSTAIVAGQCIYYWLPCYWQEVLETLKNAALILGSVLIPAAVYWGGRKREKDRSTLVLVRTLSTNVEIVENQKRLYLYRRYQEAEDKTKLQDPYQHYGISHMIFDSVIVLNYFEAICVEILRGRIYKEILYEAGGATLVGTKDVILKRFDRLVEGDRMKSYPNILLVCADVEKYFAKKPGQLAPTIPDFKK